MNWIKVSDRLPPQDGTPFLGYDPNNQFENAKIYVLVFKEKDSFRSECYEEAGGECYFTWDITHWMPLPPLPGD